MTEVQRHTVLVPPELAGKRLDQALAELFPDYSRSRIKEWINAGNVQVNEQTAKPRLKLLGGERIALEAVVEARGEAEPEDMPMDVRYEDSAVLVINKPAGLVVHPGAGHRAGTLQNGLLHYLPALRKLPRAGIVHRIDKDTSGLLIVAKTVASHQYFVRQLEQRAIQREYQAVCCGRLTAGGTISEPIGRHPVDRVRMAVHPKGKPAVTHYRVIQRFRGFTHVRINLETGRTHQIRVHFAHKGFALLGDPVYGKRLSVPKGTSQEAAMLLRGFKRQALHAGRVAFLHPDSGEEVEQNVEAPEDMASLIAVLKEDALDE